MADQELRIKSLELAIEYKSRGLGCGHNVISVFELATMFELYMQKDDNYLVSLQNIIQKAEEKRDSYFEKVKESHKNRDFHQVSLIQDNVYEEIIL